jgi:hypothetical protein
MRRLFAISSKVQVWSLNLALLVLSGCGAITLGGRPSATCLPNTAQIEVYDTGMRRGCGCAEPAGQFFNQQNSLTCTVSVGTAVYFTYVGIQNQHLIVISGFTQGFPTRNEQDAGSVDVFPTNSSGVSFGFSDFYNGSIGGTITVL